MLNILKVNKSYIDKYSHIPISFEVNSYLEIEFKNNGLSGIFIKEKKLTQPYIKDYDKIEKPGDWLNNFDVTDWGIFIARNTEGEDTGGIVIALKTKNVHILEGRDDLAVIWDIRVDALCRNKGIGKALFNHAVKFAGENKCKMLKVETQNTNVPACKFYAGQGCYLGGIHKNVYVKFPDEHQMLWYLKLD